MGRVTACCAFRIFAMVYAVSTLLIIGLVGGRLTKVNQDPEFRQPMMQRSATRTAPARVSGKLAGSRSMAEGAKSDNEALNRRPQTQAGRRGGLMHFRPKIQGSSVQAGSTLAAPTGATQHAPRQSSLPVMPKQQRDRIQPLPLPQLKRISSQTVSRADISACFHKMEHELPSYVVRLYIVPSALPTWAQCSALRDLLRIASSSDSV